MAGVGTIRRYYLAKAREAEAMGEIGLMRFWWWKQANATPATPLPTTFPLLSRLAEIHYLVIEDLRGPTAEQSADSEELIRAGLAAKEAAAVVAAISELP